MEGGIAVHGDTALRYFFVRFCRNFYLSLPYCDSTRFSGFLLSVLFVCFCFLFFPIGKFQCGILVFFFAFLQFSYSLMPFAWWPLTAYFFAFWQFSFNLLNVMYLFRHGYLCQWFRGQRPWASTQKTHNRWVRCWKRSRKGKKIAATRTIKWTWHASSTDTVSSANYLYGEETVWTESRWGWRE